MVCVVVLVDYFIYCMNGGRSELVTTRDGVAGQLEMGWCCWVASFAASHSSATRLARGSLRSRLTSPIMLLLKFMFFIMHRSFCSAAPIAPPPVPDPIPAETDGLERRVPHQTLPEALRPRIVDAAVPQVQHANRAEARIRRRQGSAQGGRALPANVVVAQEELLDVNVCAERHAEFLGSQTPERVAPKVDDLAVALVIGQSAAEFIHPLVGDVVHAEFYCAERGEIVRIFNEYEMSMK